MICSLFSVKKIFLVRFNFYFVRKLLLDFLILPTANSQQPTANSQQPTANSQQPTANSQHSYLYFRFLK
jgi:hypothetical protein